VAGLVRDSKGNLYGTTAFGDSSGYGTVFKLDTSGNETVLHSFTNTPDGAISVADLIRDKAGNLYSTTLEGGSSGIGTVFKLDTSGNETVRHSFTNVPDGAFPLAGLVMDKECLKFLQKALELATSQKSLADRAIVEDSTARTQDAAIWEAALARLGSRNSSGSGSTGLGPDSEWSGNSKKPKGWALKCQCLKTVQRTEVSRRPSLAQSALQQLRSVY